MLNESTQHAMSIIHSYHATPQKKHSFMQDLFSLWSTVACPISRSGGVSCWSHFPLRLLHLRLRWLRAARDQQTGCESGLGAWLGSSRTSVTESQKAKVMEEMACVSNELGEKVASLSNTFVLSASR